MSQSVTTVQSSASPVDLGLDQAYDQEDYDHYLEYGSDDHFGQSSPAAAASHQHSDTLGASSSDLKYAPSASGLDSQASPAAGDRLSLNAAQDYASDYASDYDYGHEHEHEHEHQHEHKQSQQPLVSPSQSHLLPAAASHEPHQGHGQQQQQQLSSSSPSSQPYESVPVPAQLHSPRSTRSHSVAASLASIGSQSSIRRKPLSPTASPLAVRFSSRFNQNVAHSPLHDLHYPQPPDSGYYSLDSPDLYDLSPKLDHPPAPTKGPGNTTSLPTPLEEESDEDNFEYNWPSPPTTKTGLTGAAGPATRNSIADTNPAQSQTDDLTQPNLTGSDVTAQAGSQDINTEIHVGIPDLSATNRRNSGSTIMSTSGRGSIPPQLDLDRRPNSATQQASTSLGRPPDSGSSTDSSLNKPLPKSPPLSPVRSPRGSSKLGNFFGWGQPAHTHNEEPTNITTSRDTHEDYSPIPSPTSAKRDSFLNESAKTEQESIHIQQHAHNGTALGYVEAYFPTPPNSYTQASPIVEIEEMEDELKAISAELASSIRREMDLEDLVERLQAELSNSQPGGKRTSDYFSDSGYSSAKYSDVDQSKEEIAQITRKAEHEKAQLRLELTSRLQDERGRRNALDQQIKELADKASQADAAQMTSKDADARVKELEKTCADLRRRLSEEKEVKNNFEDLLSALKGELQNAALERDNLRDEVVPQLRSRVEGLEAQQAENEKLAYDTTKLQQEIQTLKESRARNESVARLRSSSITGENFRLSRPPSVKSSVGLSRSNTVKSGQVESRDVLAERLKDVESQRDALHNALKNLLDRQEFQNRENEKKIKSLETERDKLMSASPRKANFEREVTTLRDEVSTLRRRAEEAIEQKWQVEKGLIGLKSDLDRAQEEITSLKELLKARDILVPDSYSRYSSGHNAGVAATSASLEKAYKDLQNAYQEALKGITNMDLGGTSASQDERTRLALKKLEQSLSAAVLDRDDARLEAASLQDQVHSLTESEKAHLGAEGDLADQLRDSANRVEELTQQVRSQLAINASLRTRLSDTITRGEATQQANKERLASMQNRMKTLEEQVITAQTAAEERINQHEEELASLREANNGLLQRRSNSNGDLRSTRLFPPGTPMTPLLSPKGGAFPRFRSSSARANSKGRPSTADKEEADNNSVDVLKARIAELEKALVTADFEMQEVVNRMNTAQIDVMMLQEERETAARETKKLQQALEAEQIKAFNERFQTIKDY